MQGDRTRILVEPWGIMPDFRLVIAFVWGDGHNVDSDDNASSPAARDWTELYLQNRERAQELVEVSPLEGSELLLVESELEELACRVAFFLATETDGSVAPSTAGPWEHPNTLRDRMGSFPIEEATKRAKESRYRNATIDDPHPNARRTS